MTHERDRAAEWPSDPPHPTLERVEHGGVTFYTDAHLGLSHHIVVAFTERTGGASSPPYDTLNLAAHVGDDPALVDANRSRVLEVLALSRLRGRLITAEQVHGDAVTVVTGEHAGSGASAIAGRAPVPSTDALLTTTNGLPLLMCYADCVPVVLVATAPRRGVAVVHAGWRGALAGLPGRSARMLAEETGADPTSLSAYIGPHIGSCCYEVDATLLSQFRNNFDTIDAVDGRLNLAAAVRESLTARGVGLSSIAEVGACTRDHTDRFFSYRASATTGRHGALAVITEGE